MSDELESAVDVFAITLSTYIARFLLEAKPGQIWTSSTELDRARRNTVQALVHAIRVGTSEPPPWEPTLSPKQGE